VKSVLVNSQRVITSRRWDYDYNQEAYLAFEARLRTMTTSSLEEICRHPITKGETPLWKGDKYVGESEGVLFIRSENLRHYGLDLSAKTFIPSTVHQRMKRSQIQARDVLLAIVGATIGQVAVMPDNEGEANCNQAVAIIRLREDINPYYVRSVLHSRLGQTQIHRFSGGSARPNLDLWEVRLLRIPVPPRDAQDRIAEVMEAAYATRREKLAEAEKVSTELKSQVNEIIFGKSRFALQGTTRTYIVSITKMKAARRFDVGFFRPEYIQLDEMLNSLQSVERLGDVAEVQYGFMPMEDYATQENGVPLIRVSNIVSDGSIDMSAVKYVRATSGRLHEKLVREKDILMVQCGNTTGKVAIVSKGHEGYAYASFCFRIRPRTDKLLPEYLLAVLQSDIGYMQVWRSITFATVRPNTTKPFTEAVRVPIPPIPTQRQILQLIELKRTEAKRLRAEAEHVVAEAKARVERMLLGEEGA